MVSVAETSPYGGLLSVADEQSWPSGTVSGPWNWREIVMNWQVVYEKAGIYMGKVELGWRCKGHFSII